MILLLALPALLVAQTPSAKTSAPADQPMPAIDAPNPPSPEKTVITVNGHAIQAKDMEAYLWDWNAPQVGQFLITKELVEQEAARHNVKVTRDEVGAGVQDYLRQIAARVPKGSSPPDFLRQQGLPLSRIALGMRVKLLVDKLTLLDFKPDDYVRVASLVIVPKDQTGASLTAALKTANDAYAALQKGDIWDNVVLKYSSEPQAGANHGERGWRPISEFPKEIAGDLATLKLKGVTQPVQTTSGIQIFMVETRGKDAASGELAELKARYLPLMESNLVSRLQHDAKITTSYTP